MNSKAGNILEHIACVTTNEEKMVCLNSTPKEATCSITVGSTQRCNSCEHHKAFQDHMTSFGETVQMLRMEPISMRQIMHEASLVSFQI